MGAILVSFVASIAQTEMVPQAGSPEDQIFELIDEFLTGLFTVELLITMVSHAGWEFFQDSWKIFDTFIVMRHDESR